MRWIGLLLLVAALLVGCSSGGTRAATGAAPPATASNVQGSSTAVPTSPPAPAVWTREEAQQQYLALVAPGNAHINDFKQLSLTQKNDLWVIKKTCTQFVTDDHDLATGLAAGKWPAEVKDAVNALIAALAEDRQTFQNCAAAQTAGQAQVALVGKPAANSKAEVLRVMLGLPGNS